MGNRRLALRTTIAVGLLVTAVPVWSPPAYAVGVLPAFTSSVRPLDDALKARMAYSWHKGCPVKRASLRYLRVSFVRFDRTAHQGELVVHKDAAADVVGAFRALYDARFPIRRMRLVDNYRGSDGASMAASNTSAFNCRRVTCGTVAPAAGRPYVVRSPHRRGMVTRTVRGAFADVGWAWGGTWTSRKDYQHFSVTGR